MTTPPALGHRAPGQGTNRILGKHARPDIDPHTNFEPLLGAAFVGQVGRHPPF